MASRSITDRNRLGFSLLELLIVAAVIAVLVGILLPTVQIIRDSARRMSCASNLHQVGMGLYVYIQNWRKVPDGMDFVAGTDWRRDVSENVGMGIPFTCPATKRGPVSIGQFSASNQFFTWTQAGGYRKINGRIQDLRQDLAFVYDGTLGMEQFDAYPVVWSVWGYSDANWSDPGGVAFFNNPQDGPGSYSISFRHRGKANHLWGDLHVSAVADGELLKYSYLIDRNGRKMDWEWWVP